MKYLKKNPQLTIAVLALMFFVLSCSPVLILFFSGEAGNILSFISPVTGLIVAAFLYSRWWMMRIVMSVISSVLTALLVFLTVFTIIVTPSHFNFLSAILIADTLIAATIMIVMVYSTSIEMYMNRGLPGQKKR